MQPAKAAELFRTAPNGAPFGGLEIAEETGMIAKRKQAVGCL